jgi:hypothetical protein
MENTHVTCSNLTKMIALVLFVTTTFVELAHDPRKK